MKIYTLRPDTFTLNFNFKLFQVPMSNIARMISETEADFQVRFYNNKLLEYINTFSAKNQC
jgi:hypothetical protein